MAGKNWRWRFYRTAAGKEIVRDDLASLPVPIRAAISEAMQRRARGEQFPREEEQVKGRIHAVRVFFDDVTYRVLYATVAKHDQILLALVIVPKTNKQLPPPVIKLAESRLRDHLQRGKDALRARNNPKK